MGVLLITHDSTIVRKYADWVYVMQHGQVVRKQRNRKPVYQPDTVTQHLLNSEPKGTAPAVPADNPISLEGKTSRYRLSQNRVTGGYVARKNVLKR